MTNPKTIFIKILDAIEFSDDKDKFADEFLGTVNLKILVDLVQTLPEDKQKEIDGKMTEVVKEKGDISEILKQYFSEEKILEATQNALKEAMLGWAEAIKDTLSDKQKENLVKLMEDLKAEQGM